MPNNSREPDAAFNSSPQDSKKPTMEYHHEPSGSSTRSAVHRRKSSINLQKTQSIAIKSDVSQHPFNFSSKCLIALVLQPKPSRSQGESSAKRKEQSMSQQGESLLWTDVNLLIDRIAQRAFRKRQKAHLEEVGTNLHHRCLVADTFVCSWKPKSSKRGCASER